MFGPREDRFLLIPLHLTLSSDEQAQVFRKASKGKRKIVLSTNIAEIQPVPEIHRIPLEPFLLRIKTLETFRGQSLKEVLRSTIEPPSDENIDAAKERLVDVGAFDLEEQLTALGYHLAALPVDVRIGKLMLFGAIFQCLDSVLTIAACLSYKSPFVSPFNKRDEAESRKRLFGIANSDHLTMLNAYRKWKETSKRSRYAANCYAEENYLSTKTLHTIDEIKQQFLELLVSIGFVPLDFSSRREKFVKDELTGTEINSNGENNRLLVAIL
ncbi:putative ATP-dependent RNA helicase DHX57 [Uranotaenia lowii]|uniref:putative ATP-dependent RNA helicase DHX57 n=1 Tax=Uranotaenia lowii TaxID=190385 RepID=UPI00247AFE99|nr:putative ATP-dependent RNA helicase DHX57 [Uranotaenia lowii]